MVVEKAGCMVIASLRRSSWLIVERYEQQRLISVKNLFTISTLYRKEGFDNLIGNDWLIWRVNLFHF